MQTQIVVNEIISPASLGGLIENRCPGFQVWRYKELNVESSAYEAGTVLLTTTMGVTDYIPEAPENNQAGENIFILGIIKFYPKDPPKICSLLRTSSS